MSARAQYSPSAHSRWASSSAGRLSGSPQRGASPDPILWFGVDLPACRQAQPNRWRNQVNRTGCPCQHDTDPAGDPPGRLIAQITWRDRRMLMRGRHQPHELWVVGELGPGAAPKAIAARWPGRGRLGRWRSTASFVVQPLPSQEENRRFSGICWRGSAYRNPVSGRSPASPPFGGRPA